MGMTLNWQHFRAALKQPLVILLTLGIQFVFMPLFAYLLAQGLQLSQAQTIGMVLVGCSAGEPPQCDLLSSQRQCCPVDINDHGIHLVCCYCYAFVELPLPEP